jgi:hypothetical protein
MARKIEYVSGHTECLVQYEEGLIDCDVNGMDNKWQADREIKNELAGLNDYNLAWVRKYIWVDGDLMSDDDYWINPAIVDEGKGGYQ